MNDQSEFVEVDPSGRYGKYDEILGRGASKIVYRAFDEYEGIEVAWNQIKLNDLLHSPDELERLYSEIHLLKTLNHPNIMKFYTSWIDISNRNINFVTEMFTSGTLRQYRLKHRRVNIRAVKNWCRQILNGLVYLHNQDPPVIHRDLKCDNIFVNGNRGEVKIGDLGLAAILQRSHADRCVGTPEFMAPEVFAESYNELVDIYSFGMCVLEMVTTEFPYSECTNQAQIFKKVTSGIKPDVLYRVEDPEVRLFVEKCLAEIPHRLSAEELLNDPFLQIDDCESELHTFDHAKDSEYSESGFLNGYDHYELFHPSGIELFEHYDDEASLNVDISIRGKKKDDGSIFLRLRTKDRAGQIRNIYFPFIIENDTALSVATEMVAELDLVDQDVTKIADMINGEISSLVPDLKPWTGFTESNLSSCYLRREDSTSSPSSSGSFMEFLSPENVSMQDDRQEKIVCQLESLDIGPLGSGRNLSDEECVKFEISMKNYKKNLASCGCCDQNSEELQRLRWVRSLYHMEVRKLRDGHLLSNSHIRNSKSEALMKSSSGSLFNSLGRTSSLPVDAVIL